MQYLWVFNIAHVSEFDKYPYISIRQVHIFCDLSSKAHADRKANHKIKREVAMKEGKKEVCCLFGAPF
jgi:hypothetical protein